MNKAKTQWHPAFCSALKLELIENKSELDYYTEVNLNSKPIVMDLLVIRKSPDVCIIKDIGRCFRGHNIFEYKSPDDALDIDTFYKGLAYACLYKSSGAKVDEIKANDITISFVRTRKPIGLFKNLESDGMSIEKTSNGIYKVQSGFMFYIQVIVCKELEDEEYIWLTSLTEGMTLERAKKLIVVANRLSNKDDKEFSESVLQVAVAQNPEVFSKVKEAPEMCEAMRELMKPEIDEIIRAFKAEQEAEMKKRTAELMREQEAEMKKQVAEKDARIKELEAQLEALKMRK